MYFIPKLRSSFKNNFYNFGVFPFICLYFKLFLIRVKALTIRNPQRWDNFTTKRQKTIFLKQFLMRC